MRISDWSSDVCSSDLQSGLEQKVLQIALHMLPDATNIDPVAAIGKNVAHPLVSRHQAALLVTDDSVQRLGQRYCATEIGRAHVWTPVTNAHLVCRLLL